MGGAAPFPVSDFVEIKAQGLIRLDEWAQLVPYVTPPFSEDIMAERYRLYATMPAE